MKVAICLAVLVGCAACAPFDMPNIEMPNFQMPNIQLPNIQLPNIQLPKFDNPIEGLKKFIGGKSENAWDNFAANLGLPKHDDPSFAALSKLGKSAVNTAVTFATSEKKANSIANQGRLQALVDLGDAYKAASQGNVAGAVNGVGDAAGKVVQSIVSSKTTLLAERMRSVSGLAAAALNAMGQARANQQGESTNGVIAASQSLEKLADELANALENDLTEAVNSALVHAGNAVRDAAINKLLNKEGKITKEEEIALINEINHAAEITEDAEKALAAHENTETEYVQKTETTGEKTETTEKKTKTTSEKSESTKYAGAYETAAAA